MNTSAAERPGRFTPRPGDLAGLRAHAVRVGCYAGERYPERPQWVEIEERRSEVASVENRWREDDRIGFLVTLDDDRRVLLSYVPSEDLWAGTVLIL